GAPANHVREHGLALDLVRLADDGRFGDARMRNERRFDLHRAESMTGDVQHIVDPAHDPEVPVLVAVSAVTRDVEAPLELLPVGLDIALVVAPNRSQHRGPGLADDEVAAGIRPGHPLAPLIDDIRLDSGERLSAGTRLKRRDPGDRRDHDRARLGLPPRIDDGAATAADHAVIPDPSLRVDRLTDTAEQPQPREIVTPRQLVAELHERADRGRRRIEDRDVVRGADLPE